MEDGSWRCNQRELVHVVYERHVIVHDDNKIKLHEAERRDLAERELVPLACPPRWRDDTRRDDAHVLLLQLILTFTLTISRHHHVYGQLRADLARRADKPENSVELSVISPFGVVGKDIAYVRAVEDEREEEGGPRRHFWSRIVCGKSKRVVAQTGALQPHVEGQPREHMQLEAVRAHLSIFSLPALAEILFSFSPHTGHRARSP
eukprot:CAMPEP_0183356182 /NCGR_PEP_ID=MMETSP0164_2-20130417/43448_1 /TAXON_ID=221442 /ORGANISM="Coccolithus pelagicus ssp braarudi, Strain PLY182g" /LENGTH=204 /DNA_ID=CAMNT_0025529511 /DNA_START=487 /DNA_END=1099 /DNA_ORIENTATION=-